MNEENRDYKLYIPSNVKTRLEFFNGYGISEFISTVIVAGVLLPISFFVYKLKGDFFIPVIIEFIGIAGTIIMTTKDVNNLCVISQIKFMIDFVKAQKRYDYKYYNKFKDGV